MADDRTELKPCPFCGGKARIQIKSFDIFQHGAQVVCDKCGARTVLVEPSINYTAKTEAVELWNTRAEVKS